MMQYTIVCKFSAKQLNENMLLQLIFMKTTMPMSAIISIARTLRIILEQQERILQAMYMLIQL